MDQRQKKYFKHLMYDKKYNNDNHNSNSNTRQKKKKKEKKVNMKKEDSVK